MARFKHTGQRLKQLRQKGVKNATKTALEAAERDLGRSLTPDEMREISQQVKDALADKPVYGGD